MKKNDFILIFVILLVVLAISAYFYFGEKENNTCLLVKLGNDKQYEYPLDENKEIVFKSEGGYNRVFIKDGSVSVIEADCKNQICVKSKPICKQGESIVCLPHKFVVTIVGKGN